MSELQKLINSKPKEFSERMGIPYSTVLKWSNGSRNLPQWEVNLLKFKLDLEEYLTIRIDYVSGIKNSSFSLGRLHELNTIKAEVAK